jgi:hypothetical protein
LVINHFLLLLLLSLSDDDEEDDEELELDSESLAAFACARSSAYFLSRRSLGAFLRYSRRLSVSAPRPMLVKKLMEKRAFWTLSRGNTP